MAFSDEKMREIGGRIKKKRKEAHLTQEQLLERIHLSTTSKQSLRSWERGERLPDMEIMLRLAEVFKCDLGYLQADYTESTFDQHKVAEYTGLTESALSRLETARNDFQDVNFTLPTLSRLLASESFWEFLRNLSIFEHECNVVESRRAIRPETTDGEKRARADYTFARYDRAVLRSALHDDLNNVMNETEGTAKKKWQVYEKGATKTEG